MEENVNIVREINKYINDNLQEENKKSEKIFTLCTTILTAFLVVSGFAFNYSIYYAGILLFASIIVLISVFISATCFFDSVYHPIDLGRLYGILSWPINKFIIKIDEERANKLVILKNSMNLSWGLYVRYYDKWDKSNEILKFKDNIDKISKDSKKYYLENDKPIWPLLFYNYRSRKFWEKKETFDKKNELEDFVLKNYNNFDEEIIKKNFNFLEDWYVKELKKDSLWKSYLISIRWKLRKWAISILAFSFFFLIISFIISFVLIL